MAPDDRSLSPAVRDGGDTNGDLAATPRSAVVWRPEAQPSAARPLRGGVALSAAERERRHGLLQDLLAAQGFDALVIAGNDYRGHKGTLRWVADYNLLHRHGFAVVAPDRPLELVMPNNLAMGESLGWQEVPVRYARRAARGVANALAELPSLERVGIVGLDEIMRVSDFELLRAAHPRTTFVDATMAFERLRAHKSDEELAGVRESTYIAERCFERLLEVARPGVTERAVGAEMYRTMYALGGEDPLFLSMRGVTEPDGRVTGRFAPPRDRVLQVGDLFIFSFELIGPLGYWMEFARMVVFGTPTDIQLRMNAAVKAGMEAAAARMVPGASPESVQRGMLDAVEAHGAKSSYWSGHGLGQDVIEEPWIGREVVDTEAAPDWVLAENMVLAMHPYAVDRGGEGVAYMANSYIVTQQGGEPVSRVPLDIHVL